MVAEVDKGGHFVLSERNCSFECIAVADKPGETGRVVFEKQANHPGAAPVASPHGSALGLPKNSRRNEVISQSRKDAGFDVPWGVALASWHPNSTAANEAEERAVGARHPKVALARKVVGVDLASVVDVGCAGLAHRPGFAPPADDQKRVADGAPQSRLMSDAT